MKTTWDILEQELAMHGITLVGVNGCECASPANSSEKKRMSLRNKIVFIQKEMKDNMKIFVELWNDLLVLLRETPSDEEKVIDVNSRQLFIESLHGLFKFTKFLLPEYECWIATDEQKNISDCLRSSLDRTIDHYAKDVIIAVPSYRITIDWVHRLISSLFYIRKLLRFASQDRSVINNLVVKTAKGVQGPWSNLDLPMLERKWEWDDIEEEVRGRDRDLRKQRRYYAGLLAYNNDGRVGEGYYWRELRNEPFSWDNRADDSPYPGRNILTRW